MEDAHGTDALPLVKDSRNERQESRVKNGIEGWWSARELKLVVRVIENGKTITQLTRTPEIWQGPVADCPGEALESCSRGRRENPAALFRELFFSFLARPPGTEPTLPETWWRFFSHVCAHLSIFHVHYISPQSLLSPPLLSSFFFAFLRLSLLSPLFPSSAWHGEPQEPWRRWAPNHMEFSFRRGGISPGLVLGSWFPNKRSPRFRRYFWPPRFFALPRHHINTFRFSTIRFS